MNFQSAVSVTSWSPFPGLYKLWRTAIPIHNRSTLRCKRAIQPVSLGWNNTRHKRRYSRKCLGNGQEMHWEVGIGGSCSESNEIGRTIQTLWRNIPRILLHFYIHIPNMHETYQKKHRILPVFLPVLSTKV